MIEQVIPRLATVAQRPAKLAAGFGGILLLNLAYGFFLVASVRAFSDDLTIAAICFVYLAGSSLGQVALAAGPDAGLAVSAMLLFRTVTFCCRRRRGGSRSAT